MSTLGATAITLLVMAVVILSLCIGIAVLIAARQGLIDVKIRVGLHLGARQPRYLRDPI